MVKLNFRQGLCNVRACPFKEADQRSDVHRRSTFKTLATERLSF